MLLGLEGLESRVMPDLVHRLIRFFWTEVLSLLQIASRGRFGFRFGTIVLAGFSAECELMSRSIQPLGAALLTSVYDNYNLNPAFDALPRS